MTFYFELDSDVCYAYPHHHQDFDHSQLLSFYIDDGIYRFKSGRCPATVEDHHHSLPLRLDRIYLSITASHHLHLLLPGPRHPHHLECQIFHQS